MTAIRLQKHRSDYRCLNTPRHAHNALRHLHVALPSYTRPPRVCGCGSPGTLCFLVTSHLAHRISHINPHIAYSCSHLTHSRTACAAVAV